MQISFWCEQCDKEVDWGYVSEDSSLILNSIPLAYKHVRKGHRVLLRDRRIVCNTLQNSHEVKKE